MRERKIAMCKTTNPKNLPPSEKSSETEEEKSNGVVNPIDKALEDLPPSEKKSPEGEGEKKAKIVKTYVRRKKQKSEEINS